MQKLTQYSGPVMSETLECFFTRHLVHAYNNYDRELARPMDEELDKKACNFLKDQLVFWIEPIRTKSLSPTQGSTAFEDFMVKMIIHIAAFMVEVKQAKKLREVAIGLGKKHHFSFLNHMVQSRDGQQYGVYYWIMPESVDIDACRDQDEMDSMYGQCERTATKFMHGLAQHLYPEDKLQTKTQIAQMAQAKAKSQGQDYARRPFISTRYSDTPNAHWDPDSKNRIGLGGHSDELVRKETKVMWSEPGTGRMYVTVVLP